MGNALGVPHAKPGAMLDRDLSHLQATLNFQCAQTTDERSAAGQIARVHLVGAGVFAFRAISRCWPRVKSLVSPSAGRGDEGEDGVGEFWLLRVEVARVPCGWSLSAAKVSFSTFASAWRSRRVAVLLQDFCRARRWRCSPRARRRRARAAWTMLSNSFTRCSKLISLMSACLGCVFDMTVSMLRSDALLFRVYAAGIHQRLDVDRQPERARALRS